MRFTALDHRARNRFLITTSVITVFVFAALLLIVVQPMQAQTESVLYNFVNTPDGANPASRLTPDPAGNFFGTTSNGGQFGQGGVFELSPNGSGGYTEQVIYSFCAQLNCADGADPQSGVIFDGLGNLYGTTFNGGSQNVGTFFELSPTGSGWMETVIHNFVRTGTDGYNPISSPIEDQSGNFYGLTFNGGAGDGAVYEISPVGGGWTEQVIADSCIDQSGIAMDGYGNLFYIGCGFSVNELSPNGSGGWTETLIHFFPAGTNDGEGPTGTLAIDSAGNVYGTTRGGGTKGHGVVYKLVRKKNGWKERILHSFQGGSDGVGPLDGITFDCAGNIYGATAGGGKFGDGTVFELVASGITYKKKILWSFNGVDGSNPHTGVVVEAGNIYGTTGVGGSSGNGVAYEVTP